MNTLNMYPNLQYDAIAIPKYCILEIYKDSIAEANSLGYTILNIEDKNNSQIETLIREKIAASAPSGYTQLAILAGNQTIDYANKIVYCVWYTGTAPTYPDEPIVPTVEAAAPLDIYITMTVSTTAPAASLKLTFEINNKLDYLDFYINDLYYKIDNITEAGQLIIESNGEVKLNNNIINALSIALKSGDNILKINRVNTTRVIAHFTPKY